MTEFLHLSFDVQYVNSITLYWILSELNLSEKVTLKNAFFTYDFNLGTFVKGVYF